ncbi:potassium transporter TrkA, partial [Streptomyces pilosus]
MVSLLPNPALPGDPSAHMVVCGDDGLAHRLAAELRGVYREQVTLVVPPPPPPPPPPGGAAGPAPPA